MYITNCLRINSYKDSHKQHVGTAFFNTVDRVIPIKDLSQEKIEDKLMEIKKIDFKINRKVITSMT